MRAAVDSLNDDDVFSLVTFNNEATVLIGPTAGSENSACATPLTGSSRRGRTSALGWTQA